MADSNSIGGNSLYSGQGLNALSGSAASTLNTGALRRKYNFGDYVSELALAQDPFFRFLSMVSKKPTDDPSFKYTEKRSSYTKRYAYMGDYSSSAASVPATNPDSADVTLAEGNVYSFGFFTDYNNDGNMTNIIGQTSDYVEGVKGTQSFLYLVK